MLAIIAKPEQRQVTCVTQYLRHAYDVTLIMTCHCAEMKRIATYNVHTVQPFSKVKANTV